MKPSQFAALVTTLFFSLSTVGFAANNTQFGITSTNSVTGAHYQTAAQYDASLAAASKSNSSDKDKPYVKPLLYTGVALTVASLVVGGTILLVASGVTNAAHELAADNVI